MKKRLLILLPLLGLCACGNSSEKDLSKIKYETGENAVAIQQKLMEKLNTAENGWDKFQVKSDLSFKLASTAVDNYEGVNSIYTKKTSADLNLDLKVGVKDNFNIETDDLHQVASANINLNLDLKNEISLTIDKEKQEASNSVKVDLEGKYGFSNIKPVGSEEAIDSDFLFLTMKLESTSFVENKKIKETKEVGILTNDVITSLIGIVSPSVPAETLDVYPEEPSINIQEILATLLSKAGFAQNGENEFYINIDLSKLAMPKEGKVNLNGENLNLKGNFYVAITFKDNSIDSIKAQAKDIKLKVVDGQSLIDFELNASLSIASYNGNILAPTQQEVDNFGYDKIMPLTDQTIPM